MKPERPLEIGENMGRETLEIALQIEKLVDDPWKVRLEELFEQASQNPDPDKRKLFNALYTYVLDKRQNDIINLHYFVI